MDITKKLETLNRIRKFSRLMDTAFGIPGTKFRFGLDPIIGLIPGLGDLISTLVSAYIIYLAMRFNLPKDMLAKMIFNVSLESVIGTIPFIGDIFDAFYKSNIRNLEILEQHLNQVGTELEKVEFNPY
jgi:hypothetical protein